MSKLILPKATAAQREAATPLAGEVFYDKDRKAVFFGDGATKGGIPVVTQELMSAYVYGIDHDTGNATASSACKRVVLNPMHDSASDPQRYSVVSGFSTMPAHNFRRCVVDLLADPDRKLKYYLSATNSALRDNGSPADLSGGDGDVMVEIPVTYCRIDTYTYNGHTHNVYLVSDRMFPGAVPHPFFYTGPGGATLRAQYVGAFRDVLCDENGAPKAWTDANTPPSIESRDRFRSIAGQKPYFGTSRTSYRAGAVRNGGTNTNALFGAYMAMMMAIEAGSLDTQSLVTGFVGLKSTAVLSHPGELLRKTGRTAWLGNSTGEVMADLSNPTAIVISDNTYTWYDKTSTHSVWKYGQTLVYTAFTPSAGGAYYTADDASEAAGTISSVVYPDSDLETMDSGSTIWESTYSDNKVVQCSWRGIEDPFGPLMTVEDGVGVYQHYNDTSKSGFWITNDTAKYAELDSEPATPYGDASADFPVAGYTGSEKVWVAHVWPQPSSWAYITAYSARFMLPTSASDGSSSTGCCDAIINNGPSESAGSLWCAICRGGTSYNGLAAGAFCLNLDLLLGNSSIANCRLAATL